VRVIGGQFKGRRLDSPTGQGIRPTPDRVREAMFSILDRRPIRANILDLFAGTGALGIEAMSRGGKVATFIDISSTSITMIRANLDKLGLTECKTFKANSLTALNRLTRSGQTFDIVFLDPPYHKNLVVPTLQKLNELGLVASGGMVVIDHEPGLRPPSEVGNLMKTDFRRYGDVAISFYAPLE
jgi:16S rRNA (guanine966-N2)-methyltransferase